jgi:hypothetical protein
MQFALGELIEMLKTPSGRKEPNKLILGWISKLTCGKYGFKCDEMLEVKPLPKSAHAVKDPIEEAAEMMGDLGKVIVVTV